VVDHLRKQGHTHPAVSAFVIDYLVPAMRVVENNKKSYYPLKVSPRPGIPRHKILITDLDEAINQLNTFLFSVMTDKSAEKPIPPFIFWMFACLYGFSEALAWYFTPSNPLTGTQLPSSFRPTEELLLLCAPDFLLHKDRLAQKVFPRILLSSALPFATSLRQAMQVLATDPILVDTGQHEPMYDKPRTYADVQHEIAKRLAVPFQVYSARCKLGTKEYTIQAERLRDADTEHVWTERRDRIILRTRRCYCSKREDVDREIAERQAILIKPEKKQQRSKQDEP